MAHETQSTTRLYNAELSETTQRRALTSGNVPLSVYGLGKMGLPLATVLATVTENVTGVDIDTTVVEQIERGESPVQGEPGLDDAVRKTVGDGHLRVTDDPVDAAAETTIHVVIVPTVITDRNEPDLSAVKAVVRDIGTGLDRGDLVILESTLPPGTCSGMVQRTLVEESGLAESEFGIAFCPERTASGRALRDIRRSYPKVVGGKDEESTRVATMLYEEVTTNDVIAVSDCTTAECVKLFEGLYRDVNIALANELATLASDFGIDVTEAIEVASMPSYCDIHSPGPGVGGHCIPYYPHFVMDSVATETPLLRVARSVNEGMPKHTVEVFEEILASRGVDLGDATVGLLGITYRAGVDETRAAPSYPIASLLENRGATVYVVDPVCSDPGDIAGTVVSIDSLPDLDLDAALLVTAHQEFEHIDWEAMDDMVVLDGRQLFDDASIPHPVITLGDGRADGAKNLHQMTNE